MPHEGVRGSTEPVDLRLGKPRSIAGRGSRPVRGPGTRGSSISDIIGRRTLEERRPQGLAQEGLREINLGRTSKQLFLDNKVLWESMDGQLVITGSNVLAVMQQAIAAGYTGPRDIMRVSQGLDLETNFLGGVGHVNWQMAMHAWYNGANQDDVGKTQDEIFGFGDPDPGGAGTGLRGPVYVAPDEAAVFEFLESFVVATTGMMDDELTQQAVDQYLKIHKINFDDKGQEHDASLAARNVIRGSSAYKDIHELRPESSNEMQWVTSQQGLLRQLGVSAQESEELGIKLARLGATTAANKSAGERTFFSSSGRIADDQRNRLKKSATDVLGLL